MQQGIKASEQAVLNSSFNESTGILQIETMGTDGVGSRVNPSPVVSKKIVTVGLATYIGIAAPGTAQSEAKWQCKKILDDGSGTVTITWADGDGSFNNVVTSIETLTYS